MESVPFVGEAPRAQQSEMNMAAQMLGGVGLFVVGLLLLVVCVGTVLLGGVVTPFYYYDTMIIIGVALGPAAIVLVCIARNGTLLLKLTSGGPLKAINLLCGLAVFLIIAPGNVVLYANQWLDRSPAVEEIVPVNEAWIRTGRQGSKSYMVDVATKARRPYRHFTFYGQEPIRLERAEWERVVPRTTFLVLKEHRGRFGFEWYERYPVLAD